jgi:hypothetical protein
MARRPPLAVVFVVVALIVFMVGIFELGGSLFHPEGHVVPSVFKSGYLTSQDRVVAGGMYLPGGAAKVGYSLEVRFQSADTKQRLSCGFYAPNGEIGLLQANTVTVVEQSGATVRLAHTEVVSAPRVQLEVVCFPRLPGVIAISMNNLKLTSVAATARECLGVC